MFRFSLIRAVACLAAFPCGGRAGLLFYEGFNYAPGENELVLFGGYSGTGNQADILEGSLAWQDDAGNVLRSTGHSCLADGHEGTTTVSNVKAVNLVDPVLGTQGDRWLAFVGRQTAGNASRFFNVVLWAPDGTIVPNDSGTAEDEVLAVGMPSAQVEGQAWRIWDRTTGAAGWRSAISTRLTTDLTLVVVKMELNAEGVSERFTMWLNPALDREPDVDAGRQFVSSDSNFGSWADITKVRIGAGGPNGGNPGSGFLLDELRIGTQFADVVPYVPVPNAVLAEGAAPGERLLSWLVLPGFRDELEVSGDLAEWTVAETLVPDGPEPVLHDYPIPLAAGRGYYRIRRSPL